MDEGETKLYPGWKNAVQIILKMVEEKGRGFIISHNELLHMMDMERPKGKISLEEAQKFELKVCSHTKQLYETLLQCHCICLSNIRGEGYQVLTSKNQVVFEPYKHIRNAKRELSKARNVVANVDRSLLNDDTKRQQERMLARIAFLESNMHIKQISDKDKKELPKLPLNNQTEST